GDTLSGVAARHKLRISELASLNGLSNSAMLKIGQQLRLPLDAPAGPVLAAASPPPAIRTAAPEQVAATLDARRAEAAVVAQANQAAEEAQPVSEAEARSTSPSLAPGAPVASAAEAIDYSIAADGSIRVAAEETLGHFADWL